MYPRKVAGHFYAIKKWAILATLLLTLYAPIVAVAQVRDAPSTQLSMTLTPPLYQITLARGAVWSSNLKFVNNNPYDLVVYVSAENFRANGETGIELIPPSLASTTNSYELAMWMTLPTGAILVPHGKTHNIPFTLRIPDDAEPGGHYAAIMVGTQPPNTTGGIAIATQVSSLLVVRVAGEVVESGFIRDFSSEQALVNTQVASFAVRFENTGNVHLKPHGLITIYNMFGRERGRIIINETNTFGNVLPMSLRKFSFRWVGERNFVDIGRYSARAELTFGDEGKKSARYTTHFWVVPLMPFIIILSSLSFFIFVLRVGVRRYVVNAVELEGERLRSLDAVDDKTKSSPTGVLISPPTLTLAILSRPLTRGVLDLSGRNIGYETKDGHRVKKHAHTYSRSEEWARYAPFFAFVVVFLAGCTLVGWYFYQVFESERNYEMIIKKDGTKDVLVSKEQ